MNESTGRQVLRVKQGGTTTLRAQLVWASLFPLATFVLLSALVATVAFRQLTLTLALQRDTASVQATASWYATPGPNAPSRTPVRRREIAMRSGPRSSCTSRPAPYALAWPPPGADARNPANARRWSACIEQPGAWVIRPGPKAGQSSDPNHSGRRRNHCFVCPASRPAGGLDHGRALEHGNDPGVILPVDPDRIIGARDDLFPLYAFIERRPGDRFHCKIGR